MLEGPVGGRDGELGGEGSTSDTPTGCLHMLGPTLETSMSLAKADPIDRTNTKGQVVLQLRRELR